MRKKNKLDQKRKHKDYLKKNKKDKDFKMKHFFSIRNNQKENKNFKDKFKKLQKMKMKNYWHNQRCNFNKHKN